MKAQLPVEWHNFAFFPSRVRVWLRIKNLFCQGQNKKLSSASPLYEKIQLRWAVVYRVHFHCDNPTVMLNSGTNKERKILRLQAPNWQCLRVAVLMSTQRQQVQDQSSTHNWSSKRQWEGWKWLIHLSHSKARLIHSMSRQAPIFCRGTGVHTDLCTSHFPLYTTAQTSHFVQFKVW